MANQKKGGGDGKGKPEHKVLVSGSIQVHRPPEIEQRHSTERKQDETTHSTERKEDRGRETAKMWLEGLALVAVLVYAGITFWQGRLTRWIAVSSDHARDESRNQFIKDQRPYVWPGLLWPAEIKIGERLRVNAYFINYGKTPAIKQRNAGKVIVTQTGKSINQQIDEFFSLIDKNGIKGDESILPPGIPQNAKDSQSFVSCEGDIIPMTETAVNFFKDTDGSFAVVGSSIYQDSYGNTYRTDYCSAHLNKTLLDWCRTHNEIH